MQTISKNYIFLFLKSKLLNPTALIFALIISPQTGTIKLLFLLEEIIIKNGACI